MRDEVLAHEMLHACRAPLLSRVPSKGWRHRVMEEALAYQLSGSWLRRVLSPALSSQSWVWALGFTGAACVQVAGGRNGVWGRWLLASTPLHLLHLLVVGLHSQWQLHRLQTVVTPAQLVRLTPQELQMSPQSLARLLQVGHETSSPSPSPEDYRLSLLRQLQSPQVDALPPPL